MLILILLLAFNAYAWFVYSTKVNTSIDAHINSWNVEFLTSGEEITTEINISIGRIYPGMEGEKKFEQIIEVRNKGETKAQLGYKITSFTILGEEFSVDEENGVTSDDLLEKITTEYPFKITFTCDDDELKAGTGNGRFIINCEWAFEQEDDALDTYWGDKAYKYYLADPDKNSIEIKMTLEATQKAE